MDVSGAAGTLEDLSREERGSGKEFQRDNAEFIFMLEDEVTSAGGECLEGYPRRRSQSKVPGQ